MKSNARVCIQEGATVEPETLIERGSAQEVNRERRQGARGGGVMCVCVCAGGGRGGQYGFGGKHWILVKHFFFPLCLERAAKCADVNSERR